VLYYHCRCCICLFLSCFWVEGGSFNRAHQHRCTWKASCVFVCDCLPPLCFMHIYLMHAWNSSSSPCKYILIFAISFEIWPLNLTSTCNSMGFLCLCMCMAARTPTRGQSCQLSFVFVLQVFCFADKYQLISINN